MIVSTGQTNRTRSLQPRRRRTKEEWFWSNDMSLFKCIFTKSWLLGRFWNHWNAFQKIETENQDKDGGIKRDKVSHQLVSCYPPMMSSSWHHNEILCRKFMHPPAGKGYFKPWTLTSFREKKLKYKSYWIQSTKVVRLWDHLFVIVN